MSTPIAAILSFLVDALVIISSLDEYPSVDIYGIFRHQSSHPTRVRLQGKGDKNLHKKLVNPEEMLLRTPCGTYISRRRSTLLTSVHSIA